MNGITKERFWAKVDRTPSCWIWTGSVTPDGYGLFRFLGTERPRNRRQEYAHRIAYELEVGPIPPGLQVDHLCNVRHCVNPRHLQPVSHAENIRRGWGRRKAEGEYTGWYSRRLYCKRGHYRRTESLRVQENGTLVCRPCEVVRREQGRAA